MGEASITVAGPENAGVVPLQEALYDAGVLPFSDGGVLPVSAAAAVSPIGGGCTSSCTAASAKNGRMSSLSCALLYSGSADLARLLSASDVDAESVSVGREASAAEAGKADAAGVPAVPVTAVVADAADGRLAPRTRQWKHGCEHRGL